MMSFDSESSENKTLTVANTIWQHFRNLGGLFPILPFKAKLIDNLSDQWQSSTPLKSLQSHHTCVSNSWKSAKIKSKNGSVSCVLFKVCWNLLGKNKLWCVLPRFFSQHLLQVKTSVSCRWCQCNTFIFKICQTGRKRHFHFFCFQFFGGILLFCSNIPLEP